MADSNTPAPAPAPIPDSAQAEKRELYDQEIRLLELREQGDRKGIVALERELEIRRRMLTLEKELGVSRTEATHLATKEVDLRNQIKGGNQGGQAQMIGQMLNWATGSKGLGNGIGAMQQLPQMMQMFGANPVLMGTTLAATTAIKLASTYIEQKDKDTALHNQIREENAAGDRSLRVAERFATGPAEFAEGSRALEEDIAHLQDKRPTLEDEAHSGLLGTADKLLGTNFFTQGFAWYKPDSARALEENAAEIESKQQRKERMDRDTREQTEKVTIPVIEAQEALNRGDAAGSRAIQDRVKWFSVYQKLLKETNGDEATASRGADADYATTQRERAGQFAHLVTARTGGAGGARLAHFAREMMGGNLQKTLEELHATVLHQGRQVAEASTRKDFSRS